MFIEADRQVLRDLARRTAEIAALPEMEERRGLWRRHNSLKPTRPLILVLPEGSWTELLPPEALRCSEKNARGIEGELRRRIYTFEHFQSDNVVEKTWVVEKVLHSSGWGLEAQWTPSPVARGARAFKPVIHGPEDLKKLRHPVLEYDEPASLRNLREMQELFGDLLEVKLKGRHHIHHSLMAHYTSLRGLEQVMMDMVEAPEMLHEAMAFLTEGHLRMHRQLVEQNLYDLNNDNSYHASGGNGFTDELPAPGFNPSRVRPCDLWAAAEAQELAQVSPEHHEEFALRYERRLLEPFGLNGYGCCEDLSRKLDFVFTIPRLRRISCSPFADVDLCAEKLKNRYLFSWKPHPSHLVGVFDPKRIGGYLRHTVEVCRAHGCALEMILKDTHTCERHPERFDEWTRIARGIATAG